MRLFVVWSSRPPSSATSLSLATIAPHPPGPGFPFAAPSVKMITSVTPLAYHGSRGRSRNDRLSLRRKYSICANGRKVCNRYCHQQAYNKCKRAEDHDPYIGDKEQKYLHSAASRDGHAFFERCNGTHSFIDNDVRSKEE